MATSDITYKTYTVKRRGGWRRLSLDKAGEKRRNFLQWTSAKKWIDNKMGVMEEPAAEREDKQPDGVIAIVAVKPVDNGLMVVVAPGSKLKDGDRVRIEATGNTDINGEYELVMSGRNQFLIEGKLDEAIEKRGRVTRVEED